jgi:hypothetical protein
MWHGRHGYLDEEEKQAPRTGFLLHLNIQKDLATGGVISR